MAVGIPDDILRALAEAFKDTNEADSLARCMFFLADSISKDIQHPFIQSLQAVISNPVVFKKVAERIVKDTKSLDKDPHYLQLMCNVWNNFMKDSLKEHGDNGQRWDLAIPQSSCTAAVAQYWFVRAVSRLPPDRYSALATAVSSFGGPMALYGSRALSVARRAQPVVRVALVAVPLAFNVIKNISRWWNGEISGKRCVKNIIDCGVSVAAGIAGGFRGEMIGAAVGAPFGPVGAAAGSIVGAVAGGILGSVTAEKLCDRLTQWLFDLPKSEALETAYNFLGLSPTASNSEVNSTYRKLALRYHPDKGGDPDMWTRLQYAMAVIKEARRYLKYLLKTLLEKIKR